MSCVLDAVQKEGHSSQEKSESFITTLRLHIII